jgi:UDP-N-acetylmuramate--alanine ligase
MDLHLHLIGIAGSGMRALAEVLNGWGKSVSGSDLDLDEVAALAARGITLFAGHAADHLPPQTELVVYSDAVPKDNPELQRAIERGLPIRSYFEMLAELTANGQLIAVAGTHGKSTTAAMLGQILGDAGMDPTVFCGAAPLGQISGGRPGGRELFVVEACEYRRNFLHFHPQQAAILGVELDHFDCYPTLADLEAAFTQFARQIPESGYLLVRHDCAVSQRAARAASCRVESFGLASEADWSASVEAASCRLLSNDAARCRVFFRGCSQFDVQLPLPGRHQVLNTLAAAVLARQNGVTPEQIRESLARFPGLRRRFEIIGCFHGGGRLKGHPKQSEGSRENAEILRSAQNDIVALEPIPHDVVWIDDYAHHPTEVEATLQTVRQVFPDRRILCIFQPHQALRTARLLDEFAQSLQNAEIVLIADIYRAREGPPRAGEIVAADLAQRVREVGRGSGECGVRSAEYGLRSTEIEENSSPSFRSWSFGTRSVDFPLPTPHTPRPAPHIPAIHDFPEIKNYIKSQLRAGDVVVTLGAGDIRKVFDEFFAGIRVGGPAG